MSGRIVETAKVLPKGQITIPKDVRDALGVDTGDRVMLIGDGDRIVMVNPATYAVEWLGDQMAGKASEAGFACVASVRRSPDHHDATFAK